MPGNSLLTLSSITREAVRLFVNSNLLIQNINRQFDDEFGKSGSKIGSQLRIRLPNDYTVSDGPAAQVQDTSEQQTVLTMATQKHVDVSFSSVDRLLSLDDFSERILLPMMNNLAGGVAADIVTGSEGGICNIVANVDGANVVLNPNANTVLTAGARLNDNQTPMGRRKMAVDPWSEARIVGTLSGLFNPVPEISRQYYKGQMKDALGFQWFMDQTILKHTTGSFTAGTVNGANQTGTTLLVNAITGTLKKGDIITLAAVNAVNRVTKQTTGMLRQFVLTADAANGATSLSIYPAITPAVGGASQQYQTVDASPANGAAIALFLNANSVYRKNFAFAPEMVTMATGDLPLPGGVQEASRHRYDSISMRSVTQYNIGTDQSITRLDVLYGYLFVRPEWGCIVADAV